MNQTISSRAPQKRLAPRLLCVMIGAALGTLSASSWAAAATDSTAENAKKTSATAATAKAEDSKTNDTITVVGAQETFRAGGNDLIPTYLDGQVANGGRIGFLGQQDARNVPFNVIGYTSKLVEDQQARTLADVVRNDASVQNVRGYGNASQNFRIRGFNLDGDDISFGGLFGVLPRQVIDTSMVERVEVFKGPNVFVNGISPSGSGVGGMINLEPKRAGDTPLTRVSLDYTSASKVGGALDVGRRFGDDDQFGVRVNALHREGETAIHDQKERTTAVSTGLDYRGERARTSLDVGYQKQTVHGMRTDVGIGSATVIPEPPAATLNYGQQWVYTDMETTFGMLRSEYDLSQNWTVYGSIGASHNDETGQYGSPILTDNTGNAKISRLYVPYVSDSIAGLGGVRGHFDTGPITHKVNLGYASNYRTAKSAWNQSAAIDTNIYNPGVIPFPATISGSDNQDPTLNSQVRASSISLSDTLSALDDKVQLVLGLRRQDLVIRNFNNGVPDSTNVQDAMKVTPVYGLLVKPWENVSLYANHIEALSPGRVAPWYTANAGNVTGIVHAKQNEVGVKFDNKRYGGTLALFEITRPAGAIDAATNIYTLSGEQRNRGVELNVFGEPVFGTRLLGSAVWLDPILTEAQNSQNNGNYAVGVARYQLVFGGEYDIKAVEGLTATGTVTRSGSQYANQENTLKLKPWTRLDLGMRYTMPLKDTNLIWRANLENVTNERYWESVEDTGTYMYQGNPRELKLSVSMDF
ncbi:TonB-dependent receptor [Yersinia enterocolitica]|uniref:TonB-dependent receptor n=1 Tax=Yersinia enterocolitica TaxID=630 RepID=UPI00065A8776|nr:TonB-dependent receptor [Yersinia enterocolitica]CRY26316.1 ferrichrome receptor protein [Yersinia enterocolitica]HDL8487986.1 TonB-dependent receptor [Yersinia enterocolitica]HDQ4771714.1 TonB-dependent receptor [Yersinia enterocolitica]